MNLATAQDSNQLLQSGNSGRIDNPSLLFEKFLLTTDFSANKTQNKEDALRRLSETKLSFDYKRRTNSLIEQTLNTYGNQVRLIYGNLKSRLAINMADGLLENAGIALDRTFGSPYIPASAFKGCCHHTAYWMNQAGSLSHELFDSLFGTTEQRGWITFLPAHAEDRVSFTLEILTPHPKDESKGEQPVPNKFPVVETGARFAFLYFVNSTYRRSKHDDLDLIHTTMAQIIETAFENGLGAKTAAGHGWFERDTDYETQQLERANKERAEREARLAQERAEREQQARIEREKAEQEANRLANEQKKAAEAAAIQEQLDKASPEERRKIELSELSADAFTKHLRALDANSPDDARIVIRVFQEKNKKKQKKFLKDKKAAAALKAAAATLGIQL